MWMLIALFIILYIGLNVAVYIYGMHGFGSKLTQFSVVKEQGVPFRPTPTPTITPTPTPTPTFLPSGKGTYTVSQKNHMGPAVHTISFDPLPVQKGGTLTITIAVQDSIPVASVGAVLKTDHGQKNLQFTRIDGTALAGNWQATVTLDDSVLYTYILQVAATDAGGTNSFATAPRANLQ
jgi:hypothetical protein